MRTASPLIIGLSIVGSIACGDYGPISESIAVSVSKGPGTRLVLTEHAALNWDRVCVFGPYSPDDQVEAVTGIIGAGEHAYDIRSSDTINVLMFIEGGRIATSVAHPRGRGDFGPEVVGKCYSRDQARFLVRTPPAGSWGSIGPS